jgi:hypothetical protein
LALADRQELIAALEKVRHSSVVTFVTGDRTTFPPGIPGFTTQVETDVQYPLRRLLASIGHVEQLDFLLYTRGGNTDAVWPLVSSLRERCDRLSVIVPFRAHSAGTLMCLGADDLVLCAGSELSPIDPTTGNQFNPVDPSNPQTRLGISVEDVAAYFKLAEDRAELHDEASHLEVFKELTRTVHPLAIGNVQRIYLLIRRLAANLLALHLDPTTEKARIDRITQALSSEFYSHVHAITRSEAIELLGPWAHVAREEEEQAIADLFDAYVRDLQLDEPYQLPELIADNLTLDVQALGAILETREVSYAYETRLTVVQQPQFPPNVQVQIAPGQPLPLAGVAVRNYQWGIRRTGWRRDPREAVMS